MEGLKPIDPEVLEKFGADLRRSREADERREEHRCRTLALEVGKCHCGGAIVYHSEFVVAVPPSAVRLGGINPMREERRCACTECGQKYDEDLPKFRAQVIAERNRED